MPGRRPALSRARIAEAALALIDRDGLEALSTRKLGAALGVEAMALYHHLPSKAAMLDLVAERLLAEVELPAPGRDWVAWLRRVSQSYRAVARRHPNAFPLLAMRRFATPTAFRFLEAVLATLGRAGFDARGQARAFRTLGYFLNGAGLTDLASAQTAPLDRFADPTFPATTAAAPHLRQTELDAIFSYGLELLLAGLQQSPRVSAARPRRAASPSAPRSAARPG